MHNADSLRKQVLSQRDLLDSHERRIKSEAIHQNFLDLVNPLHLNIFFLFVSFRTEVETKKLIEQLLGEEKIVVVPLVSVKEKKMTAVRLLNPKTDLVPGYYGILEPRRELVDERKIAHRDIQVVVLPGSVFDENGGRLGYGGGFYDRFLSKEISESALRIAFAFDLQVMKKIPQEPHDEPVDFIVTESRIIQGSSSGHLRRRAQK